MGKGAARASAATCRRLNRAMAVSYQDGRRRRVQPGMRFACSGPHGAGPPDTAIQFPTTNFQLPTTPNVQFPTQSQRSIPTCQLPTSQSSTPNVKRQWAGIPNATEYENNRLESEETV